MLKPVMITLSTALVLSACGPKNEAPAVDQEEIAPDTGEISSDTGTEQAAVTPALAEVWKADGFSAPEGVAEWQGALIISNVNGEARGKDGNGYLSRVAMDGTVTEARWLDGGMDAPKGMAVRDGLLFVTDIDRYHVVNLAQARIENSYAVEGAQFLNDVTVWQGGVYASDSATGRIYQLDENGSKLWFEDADRLAGVNGLLGDDDRMLISTMSSGSLLSITLDQTLSELATGMPNADGIALQSDGSVVVSSWPGAIWFVSAAGEVQSLLNTEAEGILQNDLTGVGDLIVVPNWEPGTVTAWRLER